MGLFEDIMAISNNTLSNPQLGDKSLDLGAITPSSTSTSPFSAPSLPVSTPNTSLPISPLTAAIQSIPTAPTSPSRPPPVSPMVFSPWTGSLTSQPTSTPPGGAWLSSF